MNRIDAFQTTLAELQRRLIEVEAEGAQIRDAMEAIRRMVGDDVSGSSVSGSAVSLPRLAEKNVRQKPIAFHCAAALRDAGRPLSVRELYNAIKSTGVRVKNTNTLRSILSRNEDFVSTSGRWMLKPKNPRE